MNSLLKIALGFIFTIFVLAFIFRNYTPIPLEPKENATIYDLKTKFSWTGKAISLWIDDNPEFTSPILATVQGNSYTPKESLETKQYYWKLGKESQARTFLIQGRGSIEVEHTDRGILLKNNGNVDLAVSSDEITGAVVVHPGVNRLILSKYP